MSDSDRWKELAAQALRAAQQTSSEADKRMFLAVAVAYDVLAGKVKDAATTPQLPDEN